MKKVSCRVVKEIKTLNVFLFRHHKFQDISCFKSPYHPLENTRPEWRLGKCIFNVRAYVRHGDFYRLRLAVPESILLMFHERERR